MGNAHVDAILEKHSGSNAGLISILEDIQAKYSYLPQDALQEVAERTGRSLVDIYGVATFYKSFSLKPRGKHLVSVCLGTACHVRGAPAIVGEFQRQLGVDAGGTTEDNEFTLETVNCLGACALGPIVVVDGHYFSNVGTADVSKILKKAEEGLDKVDYEVDERVFPVEVRCPRCNRTLMDSQDPIEGHPSVRITASFGRKHGWLRLSSLYGSYTTESEYPIPEDTIVDCFCPHCHAELAGGSLCSVCGAPMVPMAIRGGGMVQICSRRGCKTHMLDLNGVNI
jgi:NADH-quinone oxidoreductase subunit E